MLCKFFLTKNETILNKIRRYNQTFNFFLTNYHVSLKYKYRFYFTSNEPQNSQLSLMFFIILPLINRLSKLYGNNYGQNTNS